MRHNNQISVSIVSSAIKWVFTTRNTPKQLIITVYTRMSTKQLSNLIFQHQWSRTTLLTETLHRHRPSLLRHQCCLQIITDHPHFLSLETSRTLIKLSQYYLQSITHHLVSIIRRPHWLTIHRCNFNKTWSTYCSKSAIRSLQLQIKRYRK